MKTVNTILTRFSPEEELWSSEYLVDHCEFFSISAELGLFQDTRFDRLGSMAEVAI